MGDGGNFLSEIDVHWFPGHMAKARRLIQEKLKLVDVVIEVADARVPLSSRSPLLEKSIGQKPLLIVLNKADLADQDLTALWETHYRGGGLECVSVDSVSGAGVGSIVLKVKKLAGEVNTGNQRRLPRAPRCMIIGIPNVGKSFLLNRLVGKKSAKTGNRPGVTKGQQWVRASGIELLDTPGILWPKFENPEIGYRLAVTGAIKDQVFNIEAVAGRLVMWLSVNYPERIAARYGIEIHQSADSDSALGLIAEKRGLFQQGRKVDIYKAATLLLKEFREGMLGKYTLDKPGE